MVWIAFVVALIAGALNPVQSAAHGQLNKQLGQTAWAGITIYLVGLTGALIIETFWHERLPWGNIGHVSWWAWTGGLISIASTYAALMLVQKLGSGVFTSLSVTAALLVSVLLDQFGLLGLKQHTLSGGRITGCVLLIGGVWLISRR